MRLHADSYFHIGRSHYTAGKPCQDFAIARADEKSAYAIVSDATEHILAAHVQGDGVVALKYRTGLLKMWRYEWASNAPWYPIYTNQDSAQYIDSIHNGDASAAQSRITEVWSPSHGLPETTTIQSLSNVLVSAIGGRPELSENAYDLDFAAVFTDGVTQIENVPWTDAVANLLAFKTTTGEFAKRRMIREIHDAEKIGKGPLDDIAYAVIAFDRSGETP